jgi:plastocyanin
MLEPRAKGVARRRWPHLLAAALLGGVLLCLSAVGGLAAGPTIEATNFAWNPSTAEVARGESATFSNSTGTLHAVSWESGPETPGCSGVPSTGEVSWSGSCTFAQAGAYKFLCPIHPTQMKGTITVSGPAAPVPTTEAASPVGETEATLKGKVNPSGQETSYYFEYGTSTAYEEKTTEESVGAGTADVSKSVAVTGLSPATEYHFRIVAETAEGRTFGLDRTFTTTGPPSAATEAARDVGGTEATLAGSTNPHGFATKYFFRYGPTTAYGQETPEVAAGSGANAVPVSALLTGLSPQTTYHFRLVAKSSKGTVEGGDRTFTTRGAPLATTGTASVSGEVAATLQGIVNPQGQETAFFFRYGTTTAYGQETAQQAAGKGLADVVAAATLTGLSPGTTYHFQLVAKNPSGTTAGVDRTFTTAATPPFDPPPGDSPPSSSPPTTSPPPSPPAGSGSSAPDTKITPKPPATTRDRTPTVKFVATVAGATFRCSLDGKPSKACRSPFTTPSLKPGRHTIRVAARANGLTDPTPARASFKVLAKKKS